LQLDLNKRLTKEQAVDLIKNGDLKELGELALAKKRQLHPKGVTTFVVASLLRNTVSRSRW